MNSSAKVRRRVAQAMLAAVLLVVGSGVVWVARHSPPLPVGEVSTHDLPDPIELTAGGTTYRATRIHVHPRHGLLTIEQNELAFDDYGDATRVGATESRTLTADFVREWRLNTFAVLPDRRFDQQLRFVVTEHAPNTYRLIVLGKSRHGHESFDRILDLRGPEIVPDELGDAPQPDHFHFTTLARRADEDRARLQGVSVSGSLAHGGKLSIDPNGYQFYADGSIGGTTLLGWWPVAVTFKPLGPDPARLGRRAFALVPKHVDEGKEWSRGRLPAGHEYVLVLGPTELSEHRLIQKRDGRVAQVLRLRNSDRDNHVHMAERFKACPDEEQAAYRELGKLTSYRVKAISDNKNIYSVHSLDGDTDRFGPILMRFRHLNEVSFTDATLPVAGAPYLESLSLRALTFWSCRIADAGLESVGRAKGLKRLSFYSCDGLTAAGLAHLAPLTDLQMLNIRREGLGMPLGEPLDDGLKHLAGMTRLTSLNLTGYPITDAGLKHLEGLTALQDLQVTGPSHAALAAFRAKMPHLRK